MGFYPDGKHIVVHLPEGVSVQDLRGLFEGFSKATGNRGITMDDLEGPYGVLNEQLLVPLSDIVMIDTRSTKDSFSDCSLSLQVKPENATRLVNVAVRGRWGKK